MPEAVIVATARTPIGRANKGSLTECRPDELVAWRSTNGPALSEDITLRPMTDERTQIIAQMDADVAALMPSDRHAQDSLSRRLKADLTSFKRLMENAGFSPHQASGIPLATTMGRAGTNAGMNVGLNKTYGESEPGVTTAGTLSDSLTRPTLGPGSGIADRAKNSRGTQKTVSPSPALMRNRRSEPITQPAGRIGAAAPEETVDETTVATDSIITGTGPSTATAAVTGGTRRAGEGVGGRGGGSIDSTIDLAAADTDTERIPGTDKRGNSRI